MTIQKKLAVVALGGNAIMQKGEEGNIHQQFANTRKTLNAIMELIRRDYRLVITHGNGPQVGNLFLMVEATRDVVPEIPLGVCVADTQGQMGYMIQQSLQNRLIREGYDRQVMTLVTQVIVDRNDPSFQNPTKPIGPFYTKEEAREDPTRARVEDG
jgi:carbamate kinase